MPSPHCSRPSPLSLRSSRTGPLPSTASCDTSPWTSTPDSFRSSQHHIRLPPTAATDRNNTSVPCKHSGSPRERGRRNKYERQWRKLGKTLDPDDFTDAQAIAAVERITRGNFRLLERLLPQIQRVLKINELDVITNDVVEAARSTLVIGTT